jgi:hypothetical protein
MRLLTKLWMGCVIYLLFAGSSYPEGDLASVGVNIRVDPETLTVIEGFLPKNIQPVLLDTVQKLQPILLKSIQEYVAAVQAAVDAELTKTQCDLAGAGRQFGADFPRFKGGAPGPIEEFHIEEKRLLSRLNSRSNPQSFIDAYSDLHHQASVMVCQMNISNQSAAREYQSTYKRRREGNRASAQRCGSFGLKEPKDCR